MKELTPQEALQAIIDGKRVEIRGAIASRKDDWKPLNEHEIHIRVLTGGLFMFRLAQEMITIGGVSFPKPESDGLVLMKNNWNAMSSKKKIPLDTCVLLLDDDGTFNIGKLLPKTSFHRAHEYTLRAVDDEYAFRLITHSTYRYYGIVEDFGLIHDFKYWQLLPEPPPEEITNDTTN